MLSAMKIAFLASLLPATVLATFRPDNSLTGGLRTCAPPSIYFRDAYQRSLFYAELVKLSSEGNHEGIREKCATVDPRLCQNEAFDFLQGANDIQNFGVSAEMKIYGDYTLLDFVQDQGVLPQEIAHKRKARRNLRRLQHRLHMEPKAMNAAMDDVVNRINGFIEQLNNQAGEQVIPPLGSGAEWSNPDSSVVDTYERQAADYDNRQQQNSVDDFEQATTQSARTDDDDSSEMSAPSSVHMYKRENAISVIAKAIGTAIFRVLAWVGGAIFAIIGVLLYFISAVVAIPLGCASFVVGVAASCVIGAGACVLLTLDALTCPCTTCCGCKCCWSPGATKTLSAPIRCLWGGVRCAVCTTVVAALSGSASITTFGFKMMGMGGPNIRGFTKSMGDKLIGNSRQPVAEQSVVENEPRRHRNRGNGN